MPKNTTTATDPVCRTAEALTEALPRRSWLAAKGYFRPCMMRSTNYAISLLEKPFNLSAFFYFPLIIRVKGLKGLIFKPFKPFSPGRKPYSNFGQPFQKPGLARQLQASAFQSAALSAQSCPRGWTVLKGWKIKPFSLFGIEYQLKSTVGWKVETFFEGLKRRIYI